MNEFSNSIFYEFETLAEIENYMNNKNVTFYQYQIKYDVENTNSTKNEKTYYAIANDRISKIQKFY